MAIERLNVGHARAAYDAAIRAAKIEGMREAANRANGCDRVSEVAPAITALIEETEKGGNKHGPLRTTKNVPV